LNLRHPGCKTVLLYSPIKLQKIVLLYCVNLNAVDCSMVMVLNPTKSRAFTWEEMVKATQNFNRKIGQGGFGSVFFGTLAEGNDVAVKVLSLFSKAGIHQFENEVILIFFKVSISGCI